MPHEQGSSKRGRSCSRGRLREIRPDLNNSRRWPRRRRVPSRQLRLAANGPADLRGRTALHLALAKSCGQEHLAGQVLTFIHTSPFRKQDRQYSRSITVPLRRPSCDSTALTATAVRGLRAIFKPGFNYAKAGVMLLDLQTVDVEQGELDLDDPGADHTRLMETLDV